MPAALRSGGSPVILEKQRFLGRFRLQGPESGVVSEKTLVCRAPSEQITQSRGEDLQWKYLAVIS